MYDVFCLAISGKLNSKFEWAANHGLLNTTCPAVRQVQRGCEAVNRHSTPSICTSRWAGCGELLLWPKRPYMVSCILILRDFLALSTKDNIKTSSMPFHNVYMLHKWWLQMFVLLRYSIFGLMIPFTKLSRIFYRWQEHRWVHLLLNEMLSICPVPVLYCKSCSYDNLWFFAVTTLFTLQLMCMYTWWSSPHLFIFLHCWLFASTLVSFYSLVALYYWWH